MKRIDKKLEKKYLFLIWSKKDWTKSLDDKIRIRLEKAFKKK